MLGTRRRLDDRDCRDCREHGEPPEREDVLRALRHRRRRREAFGCAELAERLGLDVRGRHVAALVLAAYDEHLRVHRVWRDLRCLRVAASVHRMDRAAGHHRRRHRAGVLRERQLHRRGRALAGDRRRHQVGEVERVTGEQRRRVRTAEHGVVRHLRHRQGGRGQRPGGALRLSMRRWLGHRTWPQRHRRRQRLGPHRHGVSRRLEMDVDRVEHLRVEGLARDRRHLLVVVGRKPLRLRHALGAVEVEAKRRGSDLDHVAVREHERVVLEVAVDDRAVARAAIDDHPRAAVVAKIEVLARHRDIGEHDVVVEAAADRVRLARGDQLLEARVVAGRDHEPRGRAHGDHERGAAALIVDGGLLDRARVRARDVRDHLLARWRPVEPELAELVRDLALFDGRARLVLTPLRIGLDRGLFLLVRKRLRLWHNVSRYTLRPARIGSPAHRCKLYGAPRT